MIFSQGSPNFNMLSNGVYYEPYNPPVWGVWHASFLVGYGSYGPGQDYWILKNSWGTGIAITL